MRYKGASNPIGSSGKVSAVKPTRHILGALALGLLLQVQAGDRPHPPPRRPPGPEACRRAGRDPQAPQTQGDNFLPPRGFRFNALPEGSDQVRLNWEIADGYYLYRARIKVSTTASNVQLGAPQLPAGQVKNDEYFGRQEIYHHELGSPSRWRAPRAADRSICRLR